MILTKDQLVELVPACPLQQVAIYAPILAQYLPVYKIDTPARIGAFIAQTAFESSNFMATTEYASGHEYEGRKDLGNVNPGDGVKFKGRGLIQVTGRNNYHNCSKVLYGDERLLDTPELLAQPDGAVRSACWYWTKPLLKDGESIMDFCDKPENYSHVWDNHSWTKVQWITILVNGGLNGIAQRTANYQRAQHILGF